MHAPEIAKVKERIIALVQEELIDSWELPYENLLTRLNAAIFFITPRPGADRVWEELGKIGGLKYEPNVEKKLSTLAYRVTFGAEA